MRRILVAPDKFRGSLTAAAVAAALAAGLRDVAPDVVVVELPVADGGDGTIAALERVGYRLHPVEVEGPVGLPVHAAIAVRGGAAVIEMARTSGLALLPTHDLQPMQASSFGLGQAISAAVGAGCSEVTVALGGSASTDGGAGMLQALGAALLDADGRAIPRGGAGLAMLRYADLGPARRRLAGTRLVAACDVTNPLLGADGAALVYGPQKGATPAQARELDEHLRHLADVLQEQGAPDAAVLPGAGAAGGVGYALRLLGAEFHRGAELLLQLLDFPGHLAGTDLVITGEGSLDAQSLRGKAPVGVAAAASRAGVPVIAVVGRNALTGEQAAAAGLTQVYALADLEPDPVASQLRAAELVRATGRRIAAGWVAPPGPVRPD